MPVEVLYISYILQIFRFTQPCRNPHPLTPYEYILRKHIPTSKSCRYYPTALLGYRCKFQNVLKSDLELKTIIKGIQQCRKYTFVYLCNLQIPLSICRVKYGQIRRTKIFLKRRDTPSYLIN